MANDHQFENPFSAVIFEHEKIEYVLLHGLKSKVSMFNKNKSFWAAFHNKQMENIDDALKDTNRTVQDMPGMVRMNDIGGHSIRVTCV